MPQYLVTAKNPSGRTVTELLEADSVKALVQTLQERGWESIVLHTDDTMAQIRRGPLQLSPLLTAGDLVKNRFRGILTIILLVSGRAYLADWKFVVPLAVLLALRRVVASPWSFVDALLFAGLAFPAVAVFVAYRPSIRFRRLTEAESWHRWDEVLRLLPPLRGKLSNPMMARYEAKALAGLGRLDEALQLILPFATNGEIPQAKFWSLLMSAVHRAANKPDLALAAKEKALELAPDDPVTLIDTAIAVLDEQRDAPRAKELLQRAKLQPLSDIAATFVPIVEGMIATEERNARLAVEKLESALKAQRELAKGNATCASNADLVEGRLALAKAMAGDLDAARKHFRRAEARVRAQGYDKLLARCQQALGLSL